MKTARATVSAATPALRVPGRRRRVRKGMMDPFTGVLCLASRSSPSTSLRVGALGANCDWNSKRNLPAEGGQINPSRPSSRRCPDSGLRLVFLDRGGGLVLHFLGRGGGLVFHHFVPGHGLRDSD